MVAQPKKIKGWARTARYLQEENHLFGKYLQSEAREARAFGAATEELFGRPSGSTVTPPEVEQFLQGIAPADSTLRLANASDPNGVSIQIVLDTEKTPSTLWGIRPDLREDIEAAFWRALSNSVVPRLEELAVTTEGKAGRPAACRISVVSHLHFTARPTVEAGLPDPQLHFHVSLKLCLRESDGAARSLRSYPFFKHTRELGDLFDRAVARELRPLQHELDRIPPALNDHFSSRSRELLRAVPDGRNSSGKERDIAAHRTRSEKPQDISHRALDLAWRQVAIDHGYTYRTRDQAPKHARSVSTDRIVVPNVAQRASSRTLLPPPTRPRSKSPIEAFLSDLGGIVTAHLGHRALTVFSPSRLLKYGIHNRAPFRKRHSYFEARSVGERVRHALSARAVADNLTGQLFGRPESPTELLKNRVRRRAEEIKEALRFNVTTGLRHALSLDSIFITGVKNRRRPLALSYREQKEQREKRAARFIERERELWEITQAEKRERFTKGVTR